MRRRLHLSLAALWVVAGIASFVLELQDSVVLVWIASVYANVVGEWSAAEAADDRKVLAELAALREKIDKLSS